MNKMRLLSNSVIIYMLLALIWWSVLLTRTNQELFETRSELLKVQYNAVYGVADFDINSLPEYKSLQEKFARQKYMIIGEGMVFGIMLIIGVWFIQRSYNKELETTGKQQNFLLAITHELKSPIASINLILQTLMKRKLTPEKSTELYDNALSESHRLETLINKLLFTTKINTEYQYNLENTDISALVQNQVEKFKFNHPDIHLVTNISSDIDGNIDRESFVSLINNLLENAEKYTGAQKEIEISMHKKNNLLNLEVKDNGIGIPDLEKEKVFGQFYRSGTEETRKSKGTGLGLYIVEKIVKAHKGKVRILDNYPVGSIFEVNIPLKSN